ncbi:MAG: hypothetical protein J7527_14585, partial [Chitinophagaceae bacterium]|nr:hypothetical protein [Chitinophagaceae bacterium]
VYRHPPFTASCINYSGDFKLKRLPSAIRHRSSTIETGSRNIFFKNPHYKTNPGSTRYFYIKKVI